MELEAIARAPKSGASVILFDQIKGAYEIARWSAEQERWVRDDGAAIRITPSHWQSFDEDGLSTLAESRDNFSMRKYLKHIAYGAVVVIASGLFLGGGSDEVAGFVERSGAWFASSSFVNARADQANDSARGEDPHAPAETASLASVPPAEAGETPPAPHDVAVSREALQEEPHGPAVTNSAPPMVVASLAQPDPAETSAQQRNLELAAELDRLKQETTALRQAKATAETRLAEQTRAQREERELMAVLQQELFRAMDEVERLKKVDTAVAEKAVARERERVAALGRELQASQREVRRLRTALANQAAALRGDGAQADPVASGPPEERRSAVDAPPAASARANPTRRADLRRQRTAEPGAGRGPQDTSDSVR
jgi:hypothetical protein